MKKYKLEKKFSSPYGRGPKVENYELDVKMDVVVSDHVLSELLEWCNDNYIKVELVGVAQYFVEPFPDMRMLCTGRAIRVRKAADRALMTLQFNTIPVTSYMTLQQNYYS